MLTNYHTHTARCGHARGTEREYVEEAIRAGIKILGFADHAPTPPFTPEIPQFRMPMSEAPEYISTIQKLKEEYKNDIELHIGFECEYIPMIFDEQRKILGNMGCEYLILGQHFLVYPDGKDVFVNWPDTDDVSMLKNYVDLIVNGVATGRFSYINHPDSFRFTGKNEILMNEYGRICEAAKNAGIPLEFNMQSFRDNDGKPSSDIYKLAKEVGNKVIIGYDAHRPWLLDEPEWFGKCVDYIDSIGLERIEILDLKPLV